MTDGRRFLRVILDVLVPVKITLAGRSHLWREALGGESGAEVKALLPGMCAEVDTQGLRSRLGGVRGVCTGVGVRVEVAVERVDGSLENQAAVGAGFEVAPDFGLNGRGEPTFQVPADQMNGVSARHFLSPTFPRRPADQARRRSAFAAPKLGKTASKTISN